MYILVTYDVSTTTQAGKSRLRRVARTCLDFGQRVQNSVFECKVDPAQLVTLKSRLLDIIESETNSLRFYHLGSNWHHRVDHHGAKQGYDVDGPLIL
jgi:CRISPR-associated protein Cas2